MGRAPDHTEEFIAVPGLHEEGLRNGSVRGDGGDEIYLVNADLTPVGTFL